MIVRDVAIAMLTLGWGAIVIEPFRARTGAAITLVAAWPVGLVCWPLAAALHSLTGTGFSPWLTPAFGTLAAFMAAVGLTLLARQDRRSRGSQSPTRLRTAPYLLGVILAQALTASLAAALSMSRAFFFTPDSWGGYAISAVRLADTGVLFERVMSERAALIPSVTAGYRAFGGEWLYTIYPLTAVATVILLALFVLRSGTRSSRTGIAVALGALVAVVCLITVPLFMVNSLYVHSHLLTSVYLLLATGAIAFAARDEGDAAVWLALAGIGAAGIALARPDGFVYALVPLAAGSGIALRSGSHASGRVFALYAPHFATILFVFGAAYMRNGVWASSKLSGTLALAMIGTHVAAGAAVLALSRRESLKRWAGQHSLGILLGVFVLGIAGLMLFSDLAPVVADTMSSNLLREGYWFSLWYLIPGIVLVGGAVALLNPDEHTVTISAWTTIAFFSVAFAVHATMHPGRLGWTDSFNRIAFHAVPVVFLCMGAIIAWAVTNLSVPRLRGEKS